MRAGPTRYLAVRHERRARTQTVLASAGTRGTGTSTSGVDGTSKVRWRFARLRYTAKDKHWTLYWSDRNQRWHKYELIEPSSDVPALLDGLERHPTCIFWG